MPSTQKRKSPHGVSPKSVDQTLLWNQEVAILDATELVCKLLAETDTSRQALADRMGIAKRRLDCLLDGTTELTVRTVSDMLTHLGFEFRATAVPQTTKNP